MTSTAMQGGSATASPLLREVERAAAAAVGTQRILIISYHFPPSAAVGGKRMVNFATRLRLLGWEPEVLTIPDDRAEQVDRARLRDVEGLPIWKASVLPTFIGVLTSIVRIRRRRSNTRAASSTVRAAAADAPPQPSARPAHAGTRRWPAGETLVARMRRWVMSFALLPHGEKGWYLPATLRAAAIIRRQRVGWFMTSCPPYSVHLIGLTVRLLTRARWVADFRDPWMTTGSKRLYPTSAVSLAVERWLERQVVQRADLVVFNVARLRDAYAARYAHVGSDKFVFVPNGIAAIGVPATPAEKFDRFTICYTGSLYVGRSPAPLFAALAKLITEGAVGAGGVTVKLVGQCRTIDGVPTDAVVRSYGLQSIVEVVDAVPYAEAFDMVRRSHIALLLAPNLPYQIPAKVYDYLAAGTRILAIAEEGGTADLLQETQSGRAFRPEDVDAIADFLRAELSAGRAGSGRSEGLARYDAKRVAEELAGHLTRVGARSERLA